ncbi:MAG: pirin family protein [SAR324 cluster bacterium]|nr:pirin family protein [SAR324 cluster bacterium]
MIRIINFKDLFLSDLGWLQSKFHFSFAEYRNPDNLNFGVLRVMNDDQVAPHQGFGQHPHRDMEIVTYVVSGTLSHQDSMNNKETLTAGDIQYMSAGTGITHSEMNEGNDSSRFLQIWILPEARNLTPNYGSHRFEDSERLNKWLHLISPRGALVTPKGDQVSPLKKRGAEQISQDANFYVTELEGAKNASFEVEEGRQVYLKLIEGEALLNGQALKHGDAAEVIGENVLLETVAGAHILLIEMAQA